jgi:anti-anti-sigma regulatory factor
LLVTERPGRLVTVTGRLDRPGTEQLAAQLGVVLTEGTAFLGLDLSQVVECHTELFTVLAHTHDRLRAREGWLRLVGLSPAVLAALDHASVPEIFTVYLTSDRGPGRGHEETVPSDEYYPADTGPAIPGPRHAAAAESELLQPIRRGHDARIRR